MELVSFSNNIGPLPFNGNIVRCWWGLTAPGGDLYMPCQGGLEYKSFPDYMKFAGRNLRP